MQAYLIAPNLGGGERGGEMDFLLRRFHTYPFQGCSSALLSTVSTLFPLAPESSINQGLPCVVCSIHGWLQCCTPQSTMHDPNQVMLLVQRHS